MAVAHLCHSVGMRPRRLQLSADWSAKSWLTFAAYAVSMVSILGVFIYAFGRALAGAAFWRTFRWLFVGMVTLQALFHAIEVARHHGYSATATVGFIFIAAVLIGWIYILQWVAIIRLAEERRS